METLSQNWDAQQGIRRFTAPTLMLYKIWGYSLANYAVGTTQFVVSPRYVEEGIVTIPRSNDVIFASDLTIDGSNHVVMLEEPLTTKYLSMGPVNNNNMSIFVIIYYTLVKASLNELVYEFISRGKNP